MEWIHYLSNSNIPFYIYKIKSGDAIIEACSYKLKKLAIILHGTIYLSQIFSNQETIPISILHKNNIIDLDNYLLYHQSYYKISAIKESYIMLVSSNDLINYQEINNRILYSLLINYKLTLYNENHIRYILSHKSIKYRLIQLLIILSTYFGKIDKDLVKIQLKIKIEDLAILTGSNINITHKILNILKSQKILKKSHKTSFIISVNSLINNIYLLN